MASEITIRPSTNADLSTIIALNDLAFGQEDEGRIVEVLHEDDASLLSLVAERDSQIIGHIQYFPIETMSLVPARFAGLGPMSVHPDHQKAGIGSALITPGNQLVRDMGIQKVFVLGHKDYYPKFGFSVDETAGMSALWGGPYFMAIRLNAGGPEIAELIYPDAFF